MMFTGDNSFSDNSSICSATVVYGIGMCDIVDWVSSALDHHSTSQSRQETCSLACFSAQRCTQAHSPSCINDTEQTACLALWLLVLLCGTLDLCSWRRASAFQFIHYHGVYVYNWWCRACKLHRRDLLKLKRLHGGGGKKETVQCMSVSK